MRLAVAGILLLWIAGSTCAEPPNAQPKEATLKVGLLVSTTGALAEFGLSTKNGVDLAVKEINEAGGVQGRKVQIVFKDAASEMDGIQDAAKALTEKEGVSACIGCVASGHTIKAAPVFQEAGIPLISPSATNPTVTEQGDKVFRACFMDDFQGWGLATYAWSDLEARKVAILKYKDDPYSGGLADHFQAKFEELGGTVAAVVAYSHDTKDFAPQVAEIKAAEPDVLFIPGYYSEVALIAREVAASELKVKLLGADGWDSSSLSKLAGKALEGATFSNHFCESANDRSRDFAKAYRAEFNEEPNSLAALGYDTVNLLAKAIEAAGESADGGEIAKQLHKLEAFDGVTGDGIRINEKRNAEKPLIMVKVEGEALAFVREVKFSEVSKPKAK